MFMWIEIRICLKFSVAISVGDLISTFLFLYFCFCLLKFLLSLLRFCFCCLWFFPWSYLLNRASFWHLLTFNSLILFWRLVNILVRCWEGTHSIISWLTLHFFFFLVNGPGLWLWDFSLQWELACFPGGKSHENVEGFPKNGLSQGVFNLTTYSTLSL